MNKFAFLKIFKEIDLFGKEPDIYYKGKQKKTTWMGRFYTWIYIFVYLLFFIYKLIRMFKRIEVSFFETTSSTGSLPKIHLNKDKFTYGFALSDGNNNPIIDETLYYPEAYFRGKKTINDKIINIYEKLDFEQCSINDIGEKFRKYTTPFNISGFYCFKNFDVELEGYSSAPNYTYILLFLKRCRDKSRDGRPCQNDSVINSLFTKNGLLVFSEDFELTPYDYENPVKGKFNVNTCPIRTDQLQTLIGYYQLTNIKTEQNLFGFDFFSNIKEDNYIIYNSNLIMESEAPPGIQDIFITDLMMKENILTMHREYTQLIDVLGDVGGLMEVIESIFGVICILVVDILYDKTMVNNLFSFNLNSQTLKIKSNLVHRKLDKNIEKNIINKNREENNNNEDNKNNIEEYSSENNHSNRRFIKNIRTIMLEPDKKKLQLKRDIKYDKNFSVNINNNGKTKISKKDTINVQKKIMSSNNKINYQYDDIKIYYNERQVTEKISKQKGVIKKIQTNIFCIYCCFCFIRKRKNFGNTLFNEAMNLITNKLDIYNMFRNFYFIDDLKEKMNYEYQDMEMSTECKNKLKDVSNKMIDSFYRL